MWVNPVPQEKASQGGREYATAAQGDPKQRLRHWCVSAQMCDLIRFLYWAFKGLMAG